jgi:hypothetical protein
MSRRWYRHGQRMVFVGWDRPLQQFVLSVVELCGRCDGEGEEPPNSEIPCPACEGEGITVGSGNASAERSVSTLDDIATELARLDLPFPAQVRSDLDHDQRSPTAEVVHDYGSL